MLLTLVLALLILLLLLTKKTKNKVHAYRRHDGSFCTQKQPGGVMFHIDSFGVITKCDSSDILVCNQRCMTIYTSACNRGSDLNHAYLQDLMRFCAFALLLQICIFCLYLNKARQFYHGPEEVFRRVVNVFIAAVPTGLATVLVFSLGTCVRKLKGQKIDLLQPEKIKTIADVDVVCFDKTGTLTRSVVSSCCVCFSAQQFVAYMALV